MANKGKTTNKRSLNAQGVGKDVLETIRKGEKVNLGKIILKNGYSKKTSTVPTTVTKTKSYKEVIKPIVEQLEEERQEVIKALKKTRHKAKYQHLIEGLDKITKNIQLLSGKETDHIRIVDFSKEEMDKVNKALKGI